jgi:hypothetical protein
MAALDPARIFSRICRDIPKTLRDHIIVMGSLAAAYEYRVELQSRALHTKDADLLIHPADGTRSARDIAEALLDLGWERTDRCWPTPRARPVDVLRAIRLTPPASTDYFIELLILPAKSQRVEKTWIPVELRDGWYGLPSFRFMDLIAADPKISKPGLVYASPTAMALYNLLSYPKLTARRIASGEFEGLRRCAKDLGRVIALASLAGRDATVDWVPQWRKTLEKCLPKDWREPALHAGDGLRELIASDSAMEEARKTTEAGLLRGRNYDIDALRGFGRRLLVDAVEELERQAAAK